MSDIEYEYETAYNEMEWLESNREAYLEAQTVLEDSSYDEYDKEYAKEAIDNINKSIETIKLFISSVNDKTDTRLKTLEDFISSYSKNE